MGRLVVPKFIVGCYASWVPVAEQDVVKFLFALRQNRLQLMEQLPPEYIISPKKQRCHIPELHYCIGVGGDTLYDYAIEHNFIPSTSGFASGDARRFSCASVFRHVKAIRALERLSGAILSLAEPHWKAGDPWPVARHSNHDWLYHMEVMNGLPDEEVFDIICRELASTSTPKWYHIVT